MVLGESGGSAVFGIVGLERKYVKIKGKFFEIMGELRVVVVGVVV